MTSNLLRDEGVREVQVKISTCKPPKKKLALHECRQRTSPFPAAVSSSTPGTTYTKKKTLKKKKGGKGESPGLSSQEEILLKAGIRFYNSQLYRNSLNNLQSLITKYPKSQFVYLSRLWSGKSHIKLYIYSKAITEFEQIKDDSGEFPAALYYIAECHNLKGNNLASIDSS